MAGIRPVTSTENIMSQHFIAKALKAITIDTADATQKDILETAKH